MLYLPWFPELEKGDRGVIAQRRFPRLKLPVHDPIA